MASFDKRTADDINEGGSVVGLEVELTEAEAQEFFDAADVAGWYAFAYSQEGALATETEQVERRTEAGTIISTSTKKQDLVRTFNMWDTTAKKIKLIAHLRKNPHTYRYILPLDAGGDQVWGMRNAVVTSEEVNFDTKDGEDRIQPVTVKASRNGNTPAYEVEDVEDGDDQETWSSDLDDFKDAVEE